MSSEVYTNGMPVEVKADWQREVAGFKVLLHREGGGEP